jgi:hypothetical protein
MVTKTFSLYSAGFENESSLHPVIEIGQEHVACLLQHAGNSTVSAIEVYKVDARQVNDFEQLLHEVRASSRFLLSASSGATVYINDAAAVVVPAFKFNKEIAEDYLQIALGPGSPGTRAYDHISGTQELMLVYRVPAEWMRVLQEQFPTVKFRHTYSKIIEAAFSSCDAVECLFVQFYHQQFILCALQDSKLIIIQTFGFETPDDVSYHLLNTCNQLNFSGKDISVHLSGMIDVNSTLYTEIVKYFGNVQLDTIDVPLLADQINGFPAHYFTPFFKLST